MAAGSDGATIEALQRELAALRAERDEVRAQQAALAEVLQKINAASGDLGPVFDLIIAKAMALCDAAFGALLGYDGERLSLLAYRDSPTALVDFWRTPQVVPPESATARVLIGGKASQILDLAATDAYRKFRVPMTVASVELGGIRTLLQVPIMSERGPIGLFILYRREVKPFTDKQVALVDSFAAQAVIAMENARLLTEQREALEQQTATAEILQVISRSPTDVGPVLDAVVKAATRFCGAPDAIVVLREQGDHVGVAAHEGPLSSTMGRSYPADRRTAMGRTIVDGRTVHIPDISEVDDPGLAGAKELAATHGWQAVLSAPMLRDGVAVGCIGLRKPDAGPFTSRQIELLETFAAQAVIAIENVRLFTELRESLEQQTASADVLRVISQSPTSVQPVFDAIADSALRLLNGWSVVVWQYEGGRLKPGAVKGGHPGSAETFSSLLGGLSPDDIFVGDAIRQGVVQQVVDVETESVHPALRELARRRGWRSNLAVPMVREGQPVGVITLARVEPGAFSDREVRLLQSFAAQAVIAVENVRLFTELRESLDQQTATADILRVIAQSPTNVAPVLEAVAKAALRFCGAEDVAIDLREGEIWRCVAHAGVLKSPIGMTNVIGRKDLPGRAMLDRAVTEIPDVETTTGPETEFDRSVARQVGFRAALAAPMMRKDEAAGAIILHRTTPGAFSTRQITLLESFAAQAVIALENTRLFKELQKRTDDLTQSLEYQTATSELLEVISRSASDIQPVFDTMLASAARLCGVQMGGAAVRHGEVLRYVNSTGVSAEFDKWLRATPHPIDRTSVAGRAALTKRVAYIPDVAADPDYAMPLTTTLGNMRSLMAVPLLREDEIVGTITVGRSNTEPFTDRQISLLRTFADQAVIAMENARLLSELTQRTDDLAESLEYQTATSELLEVISRSASDIRPVFETMVSAAKRLCGVESSGVAIRTNDWFRYVLMRTTAPEMEAVVMQRRFAIDRTTLVGRTALERRVVHIADVERDAEYALTETMAIGGVGTMLGVPLMQNGEVIGAISLTRSEVKPLTDRQIALIKTFADQAVIAMENARLLSELRESLDQQTAMAEVLGLINGSAGNITPVLDTMVDKAKALCEAPFGHLFSWDGEFLRSLSTRHAFQDTLALFSDPIRVDPVTDLAGMLRAGKTGQIADISQSEAYRRRVPLTVSMVEGAGIRTVVVVPLVSERGTIGMLSLYRRDVRPFTDKQITLVESFAAQAVVAMENGRLLGELTRREEELRVTFDHMGDGVVMFDAELKLASWNRNFQELLDIPDSFLAGRPGLADYVRLLVDRGELGEDGTESQIARYRERAHQAWSTSRVRPDGRVIEVRNNPVPGGGAVLIYSDITERKKSEAEIRSARDAAEAALVQLKAAQANLVQSEKMASLGQLTAGIAHEIKNPLNFVNNFASLSVELLDELKEVAGPALDTLDGARRAEVDETMELLTGNLGKIAEHGKRADGIVKSMLSHSRGGSGDWQASDINALVEEALNLAYHGARAQDKEFNVTLERDFAKSSAPIEVVPQDVTRVFLNLFGNGFYAANKRRLGARAAGFRPLIRVSTRDLGDAVEVKVRDNGIGMSSDVRAKLFQPFFTTKPTGEGTGLGLSISYDIVTQQHGGTIEVESMPDSFTEFTVRLPRRRA